MMGVRGVAKNSGWFCGLAPYPMTRPHARPCVLRTKCPEVFAFQLAIAILSRAIFSGERTKSIHPLAIALVGISLMLIPRVKNNLPRIAIPAKYVDPVAAKLLVSAAQAPRADRNRHISALDA